MNNGKLVFYSVEELARYLNSCDGDVQVHIEMAIGQERGEVNGEEEGDGRPVFHE
ncbi:MAG: hypothetical protein ACI4W2_10530 [Eubacterium sp.]